MPSRPKAGLSTKQKVVLLAGAALLYYMYTRYKKQDAAAAAQGNAKPQIYREDKGPNQGALYYRKNDANHTVVWLPGACWRRSSARRSGAANAGKWV